MEKNMNNNAYIDRPQSRKELIEIIDKRIKEKGINCDLNDIDVSMITNMSML